MLPKFIYVYSGDPNWLGSLENCDPRAWPPDQHMTCVAHTASLYTAGACNLCKMASNSAGITPQRCSGCRMVRYCSRSHQKQDWQDHKILCRWVQTSGMFRISAAARVSNHGEWMQMQIEFYKLYKKSRSPNSPMDISFVDSDINNFVRGLTCAVCHSPDTALECLRCCSAFYCSEEHLQQDADRHGRACDLSKLLLLYAQHLQEYGGVVVPPFLPASRTEYSPLIGDIDSVVEAQLNDVGFLQRADSRHIVPVAVLKSMLSEPLTVLYGMQQSQWFPKFEQRTSLTLRYVHNNILASLGIDSGIVWEYILHVLPQLQHLKIIYVLLDRPPVCGEKTFYILPCGECQRRGRTISMVATCAENISTTPDLTVWPNTHLHRSIDPCSCKFLRFPSDESVLLMTCDSQDWIPEVLNTLRKFKAQASRQRFFRVWDNPFHAGLPCHVPDRRSPHEDVAYNHHCMIMMKCCNI